MKKIIVVLSACLLTLMIGGCKKEKNLGEVNYHVVGAYFEMEKDENFKIGNGSINPAVYYSYNLDILKSSSGIYNVSYTNISKNVFIDQDNIVNCIINLKALFHEDLQDEVKVYRILEKADGTCYVDQTSFKVIHLNQGGDYSFNLTYKFNNQIYKIYFRIGYLKRSA